jgi:hypothetical protein
MTGEPKKRSEHEREPDEYESGSVNMQFIEIRQGSNDIYDIPVSTHMTNGFRALKDVFDIAVNWERPRAAARRQQCV